MANRSYLYSIDFDSTIEKRSDDKKIIGLSEWAYMIPLAYKILVSQNSKLSESIIFGYDKPIAIIGDFHKGREKLFLFLDELLKTDLLDKQELEAQINATKEYLYDTKNENKYIILECGEIYDMDSEALEEQNKKLYENEIIKIDEAIKTFITEIQTPKTTEDEKTRLAILARRHNMSVDQIINTEKLDLLGIGYWSDVLYYS